MKSSSDFTANSPKTVEQLRAELERTRLETAQLKAALENEKLRKELQGTRASSEVKCEQTTQENAPKEKKYNPIREWAKTLGWGALVLFLWK